MDTAWVTAGAGLAGAIIGGAASLGGTWLTQRNAGDRDRAQRELHEARVRMLFATHAERVATLLRWQVESGSGSVWDLARIRRMTLRNRSGVAAILL